MANPCLTCKFATWERTKTGRLHPSGDGRCGWKMPEIVLPKAFYYAGYGQSGFPRPWGGNINRRDDMPCPVATHPAGDGE